MNCSRRLTDTLYWVGANDRRIALFENVYPVPRGVSVLTDAAKSFYQSALGDF